MNSKEIKIQKTEQQFPLHNPKKRIFAELDIFVQTLIIIRLIYILFGSGSSSLASISELAVSLSIFILWQFVSVFLNIFLKLKGEKLIVTKIVLLVIDVICAILIALFFAGYLYKYDLVLISSFLLLLASCFLFYGFSAYILFKNLNFKLESIQDEN